MCANIGHYFSGASSELLGGVRVLEPDYSSRSPALNVRVALIRPSVSNLGFSYNVKYVLTRIATPASDPPVPPAVPVSTPPRRLPPPSKLPPRRNSADHSAESHTAPRAPAASAPAPQESQE